MIKLGKKTKAAILAVIVIVWVVIIFSFSMRNGTASHSQSGFMRQLLEAGAQRLNLHAKYLYPLVSPFVEDKNHITAEDFVRKLAHFTEYFILGCICSAAVLVLYKRLINHRHIRCKLALILLCGPLVSFADERIIQLYLVKGRTSSYLDMILDCIGFYFAVILIAAIILVVVILRRLYARAACKKLLPFENK